MLSLISITRILIFDIIKFIKKFWVCLFKYTCWVHQVNHIKKSLKNFILSSFLSLLVIIIILLLLTQMDQASTMFIDLVENKHSRFSLFMSLFFVNALALVLSHFPIYNYYAANLNNSSKFTKWKISNPYSYFPLKYFSFFVFNEDHTIDYKPDKWANYLRYSLGILIHCVWIVFVWHSFEANIQYDSSFPFGLHKLLLVSSMILPLLIYIYIKRKYSTLKNNSNASDIQSEKLKFQNLLRLLGVIFVLLTLFMLGLLIVLFFVIQFNKFSYLLLLIFSITSIYYYLFFRLVRTKIRIIMDVLQTKGFGLIICVIKRFRFFQKSENYLMMFNFNFLVAALLLIFGLINSLVEKELINGLPLLLAIFYFYYFILASASKFFFVSRKMERTFTKMYIAGFTFSTVFVVLLFITLFGKIENTTHELNIVTNKINPITETQFVDSLRNKKNKNLFFIASHGGGLKANIWTLNLVNEMQYRSQGALFNHTIGVSGASGGSLGLAIYIALYKKHSVDFKQIQNKIDLISTKNYTSIDLVFTFGIDTYRKLWPLNQKIGNLRDRPYYAMRKYANIISGDKEYKLSDSSFQDFWAESYNKQYTPSLVMNTSSTKGKRGVFWSVYTSRFNEIFSFTENLGQMKNNKSLPYYQDVSTTNRFPIFSPAAKIKGYGHYIDAGAIDNSGLLSCIDLHNYLKTDSTLLKKKKVNYIEIINSKSLYVKYLITEFEKKHGKIPFNENETDNIMADLQTALNLDKIPGYLSDYLNKIQKWEPNRVGYYPIFLPHKIGLKDFESALKGKLHPDILPELEKIIDSTNKNIFKLTESPRKSLFENYTYYEPTLSRHLSKSSNAFFKAMMKDSLVNTQINKIIDLVNK